MKILQLCKKFPYPEKDGESIAVMNLSKALSSLGEEIHLLAMNTSRHRQEVDVKHPALSHYKSVQICDVDNKIQASAAFINLFKKESYHISRFVSKDFSQKLIDVLNREKFDVIQLETLYLAPYIQDIRHHSKALIAMRAHNIEHEIWERVATSTGSIFRKIYLKYLTKKLKKFEINQFDLYDLLISISDRDLSEFKRLGYQNEAISLPIGLDTELYQPNFESFNQDLSISFIGSLDWMPNSEGLFWFLDEVWPSLSRKFPKLKIHIAGRNTPKSLYSYESDQVIIDGEVKCARKFINEHPLMIVPLKSGSGMRAKILEGMALGRVVLSTSIGLEGIYAAEGHEVFIANTKEDFINAIGNCVNNQNDLVNIAKNARTFVEKHFDHIEIAKDLVRQYGQVQYELIKH